MKVKISITFENIYLYFKEENVETLNENIFLLVLIRLANTKLSHLKEFPSKEPIRHLRDLHFVHCPTVELPVRISGDYSQSIVGISKWKSEFLNCTGINEPKRIECIGLNGRNYLQLLKGTDDLKKWNFFYTLFIFSHINCRHFRWHF